MAEYKGIDRVDKFFEHYGRKGMKRGMNIYNPDYKPVGEKAQGTSDGKIAQRTVAAKAKRGAMTGDPRYSNSPRISVTSAKPGAMNNDPRYSNSPRISVTGVQSSAKDSERDAMNAAAGRATASGAKEQIIKTDEERLLRGDAGDDARSIYLMLLNDTKEPSEEQINKINAAFEKAVGPELKKNPVYAEMIRDNSKKALVMKALSMIRIGDKKFNELAAKAKSPRIKVENDAQIDVEDNTAKGREREAMNRASQQASKSGAKSAREKLLEAERKRQANIYRR